MTFITAIEKVNLLDCCSRTLLTELLGNKPNLRTIMQEKLIELRESASLSTSIALQLARIAARYNG